MSDADEELVLLKEDPAIVMVSQRVPHRSLELIDAFPEQVSGGLADLFAAYRAELDRLGLWDRELEHAHAAERVASDFAAWDGRPVFAYGFEDLTAAQWRLLEALAGRAEVTVSLPYEPARTAFATLERTASDLAALASGQIEELPPRYAEYAHPALAHLERSQRSHPAGLARALYGEDGRGDDRGGADRSLDRRVQCGRIRRRRCERRRARPQPCRPTPRRR